MLIQKPILTEKSQRLYQKNKTYVFLVFPKTNKFQIKKELENIFQVKVKKIRSSQKKSVLQKTRYLQKSPGKIYTKLQKKVFVELMPGYDLPNFFSKEASQNNNL